MVDPEATTDGRRVTHGGEGRRCKRVLGRIVDQDVNFQAIEGLRADPASAPRVDDMRAQHADPANLDFERVARFHP
jgi:hypothetical protein